MAKINMSKTSVDSNITIEVCYSLSDNHFLQTLTCPQGTTMADAIKQSGVLQRFSEIDLTRNKIGVYAQFVELNDEVKDGDRIEIYRELTADPKAIRQMRIAKAEQEKKDAEKEAQKEAQKQQSQAKLADKLAETK